MQSKCQTIKIYNPPEDLSDVALIYETENFKGKVYVYVISQIEHERVLLYTKDDEKEVDRAINAYWKSLRQFKNQEVRCIKL